MNITDYTILSILFAIISYVGGLIIKSYFSPYLKKKGENQATKEDIENLTNIVKSVESNFNKELEDFKFKLDIKKSIQISYHDEEKKALIQFHGHITEWIQKIFSVQITEVSMLSYDEIERLRKKLDLFPIISVALSKVRLLVKDEEIVKLGREFLNSVIFYRANVDKVLMELQFKVLDRKSLDDQFQIFMPKNFGDDVHPKASEIAIKSDQINKEIQEIISRYSSEQRMGFYNPVRIIDDKYVDEVKKYLTS